MNDKGNPMYIILEDWDLRNTRASTSHDSRPIYFNSELAIAGAKKLAEREIGKEYHVLRVIGSAEAIKVETVYEPKGMADPLEEATDYELDEIAERRRLDET